VLVYSVLSLIPLGVPPAAPFIFLETFNISSASASLFIFLVLQNHPAELNT